VFFRKFAPEYTEVRVKRESNQLVKFDAILSSNMIAYDILNLILYIRSYDYSQWQSTPQRYVSTFVGRDKVIITVRCEGQSIIEKSDTLKYKTYKIALDFTDSVFNESKNAIEVWLSDDKNRIPIKIRAKLRVGAAEVNLTSWQNLKYPLSSEIRIPAR
jgi:glutaredoxin-related protein